jgi:hypothetical protein
VTSELNVRELDCFNVIVWHNLLETSYSVVKKSDF